MTCPSIHIVKEVVCNKQGRQCAYESNIGALVLTIILVHIKTYHIFWVCVRNLRCHTKPMHRIILQYVLYCNMSLPYFSTLSLNGMIFVKTSVKINCVF